MFINKYDTIIWDWNGTLLNDVWLCVDIVNNLLTNHNNRHLNELEYKEVFGFPIVEYYNKIGIDLQKESFDRLTHKFISNYEAKVKECLLHVCAQDVLHDFSKNNFNQFMLTAAHKESVLPLLNHHMIEKFFMEVEGLDNHRAESKVHRGKHLIAKIESTSIAQF